MGWIESVTVTSDPSEEKLCCSCTGEFFGNGSTFFSETTWWNVQESGQKKAREELVILMPFEFLLETDLTAKY